MSKDDMADKPGKDTSKQCRVAGSGRRRKIARVLRLLYEGISLNRFEAERHHDHCLHTTVATLAKLGIVIDRCFEWVPCLDQTATVRVKRYWLRQHHDNVGRARAWLEAWGELPHSLKDSAA